MHTDHPELRGTRMARRRIIMALVTGPVISVSCRVPGVQAKQAAESASPKEEPSKPGRPTLQYPIGIVVFGNEFQEIIPARKDLPIIFSEQFATALDNQPTVRLSLGQRRPGGIERICDVGIEDIPPGRRTTQSVIVTVEVSDLKKLTAKLTVQSTGAFKRFGPYAVE